MSNLARRAGAGRKARKWGQGHNIRAWWPAAPEPQHGEACHRVRATHHERSAMDDCKPLRVVAISPHSDDVALSVTHSLDAIGRTDAARIELVTCFSRSEYTPFSERFPV